MPKTTIPKINVAEILTKLTELITTKEAATRISNAASGLFDFKSAFFGLETAASALNAELLLTRSRIGEFKVTIADTLPLIAKLGGGYEDTMKVISESIEAMGRNVIFEPEIYEKLYAAQTLIGKDTSTMITQFGEAGIMASKIGKNLENSLDYIRTIGVNAKSVMGSVVDNTEMLNRFSFSEGVLGFTKMAAQASILKVNMGTISNLADKVFEPEGAIEMASAFQRLGVFVGDLADPFMLMNKSLNDPEGLIMSVAKAGEKFTQFNEEAGRFEINPSAMNQMSKMAEAVGMTVAEFKKMSLNLAEFNARAGEIDIKFNLSDDQKMFVANLAYLDTDNEYKIKITDEKTGESIITAVKDLTDKQITQLDKLSKQEPKTLEELTRDSMDIVATIASDLGAIKYKILFGAVSEQSVMGKLQENIRTGASAGLDILYKTAPGGGDTRKEVRNVTKSITDTLNGGDPSEKATEILNSLQKFLLDIPNRFYENVDKSPVFGLESVFTSLIDKTSIMFGDIKNKIDSNSGFEFGEMSDIINKNTEAVEKGTKAAIEAVKETINKLILDINIKQMNSVGNTTSTSSINKVYESNNTKILEEKITINTMV